VDILLPPRSVAIVGVPPLNPTSQSFNKTGIPAVAKVTQFPFSACMGRLICGTWDINADGLIGKLVIRSVTNDGKINGSIFSRPFNGSWDEPSKSIRFIEKVNSSFSYTYAGFLTSNFCGASICYTLAGSYSPSSTAGPIEKHALPWLAFVRIVA
jgi:hypothetical protein